MTSMPPTATIRTQLRVPLRSPDGFETTARVFTFEGPVDGGSTWLVWATEPVPSSERWNPGPPPPRPVAQRVPHR